MQVILLSYEDADVVISTDPCPVPSSDISTTVPSLVDENNANEIVHVVAEVELASTGHSQGTFNISDTRESPPSSGPVPKHPRQEFSKSDHNQLTNGSNDVKLILEKTSDGRSYFGLYKRVGFDNSLRSDLAKYIVSAELAEDENKRAIVGTNTELFIVNRITPEAFKRYALQIVELFPEEVTDTWYIPRRKKTPGCDRAVQPKGKLYDQYTKLIAKLRKAGMRNAVLTPEDDSNLVDNNLAEVQSSGGAAASKSLQWLQQCLGPQTEATVKWKETASLRLQKLRSTEQGHSKGKVPIDSVTRYFEKFKVLRRPWGYTLLEQDFAYLYPNAPMQLLSNWPRIASTLKKLIKKPIVASNSDEEIIKLLLGIPALFSPVNVGKWRPTSVDVTEGFLLHVKAFRDIETVIERMRLKTSAAKKTLQPFPVVVGLTLASITDCYVYIDSFPFKVESPIRAIDVCFKVYHALHAYYPFQSYCPWLFLQQAIYKLRTKWDESVPSVATLVNDYLRLEE